MAHLFVSVLVCLLLAHRSTGFMPNRIPVISTLHPALHNSITHAEQTQRALDRFHERYLHLDTRSLPNSVRRASQEIIDANAATDTDAETKHCPAAHFDNEEFGAGQARLTRLRGRTLEAARAGDYGTARRLLGTQLHALQDFYAHSNWVEMGLNTLSDVIGVPGERGYPKTRAGLVTCTACRPAEGVSRAQYEKGVACLDRAKSSGDGGWAMVKTWTKIFVSRLLRTCPVPLCDSNLIDLSGEDDGVTSGFVTSGYYYCDEERGKGPEGDPPPPGKCVHGGVMDKGARGNEGINKDTAWDLFSPHGPIEYTGSMPDASGGQEDIVVYYSQWHEWAANLGIRATFRYFQNLLVDFPRAGQYMLSDEEIRHLFGHKSNDAVWVEGGDLGITDRYCPDWKTGCPDSDRWPRDLTHVEDEGGYRLIKSPADILGMLQPSHGDKTKRAQKSTTLARHEVVEEIKKLDRHSIVFFRGGATDVSSDFESMLTEADFTANPLNFHFILPDVQSPAGGVSASQQKESTASAAKAIKQLVDADLVSLHAQATAPRCPADDSCARSNPQEISVAVDSTTETLFFQFGPDEQPVITRPDGSVIHDDDADVSVLHARNARLVTVERPASGLWTVCPDTSMTTMSSSPPPPSPSPLTISASSRLNFNRFEFVGVSDGPHPGWFSLGARLEAGAEHEVIAELEGGATVDGFELRSAESGAVLRRLALVRDKEAAVASFAMDEEGEEDEETPGGLMQRWHGNVALPCGEFYGYVVGRDGEGARFQRTFPTQFEGAGSCNG